MKINGQEFTGEVMRAFKDNGMGALINREKCEKLLALTERMLEENEKYNLTAITEPSAIILNHYLDCATLSSHIKRGATVIDVGCGAGFPTLPLSILRDDIKITALDATAKRVNYVAETAELLSIEGVKAICGRAEDIAKLPEYREKFDYATARAVAELRTLTELCLPFVRVGGEMIAMKGKNAEYELSGAARAIATLGGGGRRMESVTLKGKTELITHPLIIIEKKTKTPTAYPRPFAKISKSPL